MALSNYPSPDSKTLFSLDAARLVFEMFKSTINPGGKCFVDASNQPILFELAAHAGFHQAFSFMDFDLKRISQYLEFVLPRLNKDQLQAHRVGAAFRDSGCIVWPRNTHLLVLTVPDLKNGMRIWENVEECIQKGTALHHLEVLAVIHDPEFDGADLLGQLQRLSSAWSLKDELTCSNSERFKSEKIIVKLFLRGSAAGLGDGDVLMGDGEEARKDCLPTRSLQSDILISILESDSRHGLFLRDLVENPSKTPSRDDGHLYLELEEWNHISRMLLEISPGMSVGNVIGSGGFGIVLSTTIFSEDGSRIDESALKLCVALLDHYWNQTGFREFNFMHSMMSNRGSGWGRLGRGGGGPVDLATGGVDFLKTVDCFSKAPKNRKSFAIFSAAKNVVVSALNMERLEQTFLPILECACQSYQSGTKIGLEPLRNITRELICEMQILNRHRQFFHGDVKPQNIMTNYVRNMDGVTTRLKVHLVDFGGVQQKGRSYLRGSSNRETTKVEQHPGHWFPPGKDVKAVVNGTPWYYRKELPSKHDDYFCDLYPSENDSQNRLFESELFRRDQTGLAITLLHAVIPRFEAKLFWENFRCVKEAEGRASFLFALERATKARKFSTEYLESHSCWKLLDLIYKLLFEPGFDWTSALKSLFVLEPVFSLEDESSLSKGIVIRGKAPGSDVDLTPHLLMNLPGKGLVVIQYHYYKEGQVFGYYAGRLVKQGTCWFKHLNNEKGPKLFDPRMVSAHVLPLRHGSDDAIVGDISHDTPLSTYLKYKAVLSFAQSCDGSTTGATLQKPDVYCSKSKIKIVKLENGTQFGLVEMRAHETKAEDRGTPRVTSWNYDWRVLLGGLQIYSPEEEESRAASANEPIDADTLIIIKARFR